jgi:hypothetical protein
MARVPYHSELSSLAGLNAAGALAEPNPEPMGLADLVASSVSDEFEVLGNMPLPRRQTTDSVLDGRAYRGMQSINPLRQDLESVIATVLANRVKAGAAVRPSSPTETAKKVLGEGPVESSMTQSWSRQSTCISQADSPVNCPKPAANGCGLGGLTTAMVRHLPPKLSQRKFVRTLNAAGLNGQYDFVYVPMDSRRHDNRGVAFVNFTSAAMADRFCEMFNNKPISCKDSRKGKSEPEQPVSVLAADIQGFENNAFHHLSVRKEKNSDAHPLFLRPLPSGFGDQSRAAKEESPAHSPPRCPTPPGLELPAKTWLPKQLPAQPPQLVRQPQVHPSPQAAFQPRFCGHCGGRRSPEHSFCPFCGNSFADR